MQQDFQPDQNTKEISPGIYLQKIQQMIQKGNNTSQQIYIFKITNNKLNIIEFTADFSGSQNILLENRSGLIQITSVDPYQQQIVAKLILQEDWKLKSKFKFTLKPAPKAIQQEHMRDVYGKLQQEIKVARRTFQKYPFQSYGINEVANIVQSHNLQYIDSQFLPNDESIYGSQEGRNGLYKLGQLDTMVHWRRPQEFMEVQEEKQIDIFYDDLEPTDIMIGEIDNINLYSAIACLTERPALIDRLFIQKQVSKEGVYRVKICKNGEWQIVTIDDLFPCYPFQGPIFGKNHQNELWMLILEKAYAKLHGNYLQLKQLSAKDVLGDLSGCACESVVFQEEENQVQNNEVWEKIVKGQQEGYLICCFQNDPFGFQDSVEINSLQMDQQQYQAGQVYAVIQAKQYKGIQLLNIRNPWGNFRWQGDWCRDSSLWNSEFIQEFGANFDNLNNNNNQEEDSEEDNFWISFQDFVKEFLGVYILKIKNWNEVRVKGKYVRVQDQQDVNIEDFQSKFYYQLDIPQETKVCLGLHQEDNSIEGVKRLRPMVDMGFIVFNKTKNNELVNVCLQDLKHVRETEQELYLEKGTYLILPRSTGCLIKIPQTELQPSVQLMENNNSSSRSRGFNRQVVSVIKDIFRKFDVFLTRELGYHEFCGFYEAIDRKISHKEFEQTILTKYQSTRTGVTLEGFIEYFKDSVDQFGENLVWKWFEFLGYNNELKSIRTRNFILSIHSDQEVQVLVRDALQTDLNHRANILQVSGNGEEVSIEQKGIRLFYSYNKFLDCYTYAAINEMQQQFEVVLNCQDSRNALFSTKNGTCRKVLGPQQLQFLMNVMKNPYESGEFKHVMDFNATLIE